MSAFEDDVEPVEEPLSRSGTPSFGGRGRGAHGGASSSSLGNANNARPLSPEPDEDLDTTDGRHTMWLVKVPRFLLEGWSKVDEDDKKLGTVRVYDPDHRGHQRMELLLPEAPEPAIPLPPSHPYLQTNYPRKYDLRLTSEQENIRVRNLYAFKERLEGADEDDDDDLDSGLEDNKGKMRGTDDRRSKGRRSVAMVGTIANEAALKPQVAPSVLRAGGSGSHGVGLTPEYREVLRKRRQDASKPRHAVKLLDDSDRAQTNMLSSGVMGHSNKPTNKASLIANANTSMVGARGKGQSTNEKFARMPRNELLDLLFELFDQYPYWSIKGLRGKVQQPEVYLREVLTSIADLHKRGPYVGNWSLKPEFVEMRKQQDRANNMAASALAGGSSTDGGTIGEPLSSANGSQSIPAENSGGGPSNGLRDAEDDEDEDDMAMEDVA